MLETEPPLAEIDLARNARIDHPLERPVDGGAADLLILATNQIEQVVGRQVPFLPRNTFTMRSRLPERLLPAGRRLSR